MLQKIRKRTGQSTLEYAVLVVVLIGALLAVQKYIKRGIMGRAKESTDDISSTQFEPEITVYKTTTNTSGRTHDQSNAGISNSVIMMPEETNTTTNMYYR